MPDLFSQQTTPYEAYRKAIQVGRDPAGLGFVLTHVDPAVAGAAATCGNAAGRIHYYRAVNGGVISKIGYEVGVQSGNICVSVHKNSGVGRAAVPGTRIATSGSVVCPVAGYTETALGASVRVEPGDWLAVDLDNNTAQLQAASGPGVNNLVAGLIAYQDATFPAPATPAITAYGGRSFALVGVA